jgi:pimeloyl-ACP methyl ester carboxylesterase
MALRYPERVSGLILVRPAWLAQGRPANLEILLDLVDYLERPDGEAQFAQTEALQQMQADLPQAAASVMGMFSRQQQADTPRILTQLVPDAPFADMASLAGIQQPSLVLGNEDDPLHPLEIATEIAAMLPNSSLKTVTSRYIDAVQHRQEVRDLVLSFLANR